jgi:hypothetical protein
MLMRLDEISGFRRRLPSDLGFIICHLEHCIPKLLFYKC